MIQVSGSGVRDLPDNIYKSYRPWSLSIGGPFWMTEIIELIQYVDKDQAALYIPKDVSWRLGHF